MSLSAQNYPVAVECNVTMQCIVTQKCNIRGWERLSHSVVYLKGGLLTFDDNLHTEISPKTSKFQF